MYYRRLGRTELMVSETGLDADPLRDLEEDAAIDALRAAMASGVTLVTWTVSDATADLEPLLVRAAGSDRGRLTLVAALDALPAPEDLGPQVEAITARLVGVTAAGAAPAYLDIVALPAAPSAEHLAALADLRARGTLRFAAIESRAPIDAPAGIDVVVVADGSPAPAGDVGVLVRGEDGVHVGVPAAGGGA